MHCSTRCSEYVLWIWQRNPASIDRISASKFSWLIRNASWKVMFACIPHEHRAYLTQVFFIIKNMIRNMQDFQRGVLGKVQPGSEPRFHLCLRIILPDQFSGVQDHFNKYTFFFSVSAYCRRKRNDFRAFWISKYPETFFCKLLHPESVETGSG